MFVNKCLGVVGPLKGVVHLGAHKMEELEAYEGAGAEWVIWVEPLPDLAEACVRRIMRRVQAGHTRTTHIIHEVAAADTDGEEYSFFRFNAQEASSLFKPGPALSMWYPDHKKIEEIAVRTARVDSLLELNGRVPGDVTYLSLDVQGAEILALRGAEKLLSSPSLRYIQTEVSWANLYEDGAALKDDLEKFLLQYDFKPAFAERHHPTNQAVWMAIDSGRIPDVPQADVLFARV